MQKDIFCDTITTTTANIQGNAKVGSIVSTNPAMTILNDSDLEPTLYPNTLANLISTWDLADVAVNNGNTVSAAGVTVTKSGWYDIDFSTTIANMTAATVVAGYLYATTQGSLMLAGQNGTLTNSTSGTINLRTIAYVNAGNAITASVLHLSSSTAQLRFRRLIVKAI